MSWVNFTKSFVTRNKSSSETGYQLLMSKKSEFLCAHPNTPPMVGETAGAFIWSLV